MKPERTWARNHHTHSLNHLPCVWTWIQYNKPHATGHRVSNPLHVCWALEGLLPSCSSSRFTTHPSTHIFPFPHFLLPFIPHQLLLWIFPVPCVVADPIHVKKKKVPVFSHKGSWCRWTGLTMWFYQYGLWLKKDDKSQIQNRPLKVFHLLILL